MHADDHSHISDGIPILPMTQIFVQRSLLLTKEEPLAFDEGREKVLTSPFGTPLRSTRSVSSVMLETHVRCLRAESRSLHLGISVVSPSV
jgi:hypothetical protein